jgi:tetratricopeptide (TPR) repeat protein
LEVRYNPGSKSIRAGANKIRRTILIFGFLTLVVVSSGCIAEKQAPAATAPPTPKPITFSQEMLEKQIGILLMSLAYDGETAQRVAAELANWSDKEGNPLVGTLEAEHIATKKRYEAGEITIDELAEVEVRITRELAWKIKEKVPNYNVENWHLEDVITGGGANCVGYTQLLFVFGEAVGLSVEPIEVVESKDLKEGHVTGLINLSDERFVMVELTSTPAFTTQAFKLEEEYMEVGNYLELQNEDFKIPHYRIRTMDKDGLMAALFISRGNNFESQGEYAKALAENILAIELDPKYALAYNNRGAVLHRLGYLSDALADLDTAIKLDPRFSEAYGNRGVVNDALGEHQKAVTDYTRAIELSDEPTAVNYNNRGISYSHLGEYEEAISDYTRALALDPGFAKAYYGKGYAYSALGNYTQAVSEYTKAIELEEDYFGAYTNRGAVYSVLKNYTEAASDYTKALELDPQNAIIYYNRGNANYNLGNYSGAVSDYTKAIEIDAYFADAYNNRGNAYSWLGDTKSAESDFEMAGSLDETLKR